MKAVRMRRGEEERRQRRKGMEGERGWGMRVKKRKVRREEDCRGKGKMRREDELEENKDKAEEEDGGEKEDENNKEEQEAEGGRL